MFLVFAQRRESAHPPIPSACFSSKTVSVAR